MRMYCKKLPPTVLLVPIHKWVFQNIGTAWCFRSRNKENRITALTLEALANFIFEMGPLRLEPRRGWQRLNLRPENVADQTRSLGESGSRVQALWHEMHLRRSQAARIAKDADLLEMAFTARQLMAQGHSDARHWFDSTGQGLSTDTARRLHTALERVRPTNE